MKYIALSNQNDFVSIYGELLVDSHLNVIYKKDNFKLSKLHHQTDLEDFFFDSKEELIKAFEKTKMSLEEYGLTVLKV